VLYVEIVPVFLGQEGPPLKSVSFCPDEAERYGEWQLEFYRQLRQLRHTLEASPTALTARLVAQEERPPGFHSIVNWEYPATEAVKTIHESYLSFCANLACRS
jgi:hypothetical protein